MATLVGPCPPETGVLGGAKDSQPAAAGVPLTAVTTSWTSAAGRCCADTLTLNGTVWVAAGATDSVGWFGSSRARAELAGTSSAADAASQPRTSLRGMDIFLLPPRETCGLFTNVRP